MEKFIVKVADQKGKSVGKYSKKKIIVYPAMWSKPTSTDTIFVSDANLKYAKPYALKTILDNL